MSQQPKNGDRVRLLSEDFEPDYLPGDTGIVLSGPHPAPSGGFFYVVTMEKDGPGTTGVLFKADDIEVVAVAVAADD